MSFQRTSTILYVMMLIFVSMRVGNAGFTTNPDYKPPVARQSTADFKKSIIGDFRVDTEQFPVVTYYPTIMAGAAPDSPAARVDPNTPAGSPYAGVGSVVITTSSTGTFLCSGSVISPNQFISAAHCFDVDDNGAVDPGLTISFQLHNGGTATSVHTANSANVNIHPNYGGFTADQGHDDLAIVTVSTSVPAGTPIYPIRSVPMTAEETLTLVGYGVSGNGGNPPGAPVNPASPFEIKRTGKNNADGFSPDDEAVGPAEVFIYDFDGPTGTGFSGGPTLGNAIETKGRPGDSGGPAFVTKDGLPFLAGVNNLELQFFSGLPSGAFGELGGGLILSSYTDWIAAAAPNAMIMTPEPGSLLILGWPAFLAGLVSRRRRLEA